MNRHLTFSLLLISALGVSHCSKSKSAKGDDAKSAVQTSDNADADKGSSAASDLAAASSLQAKELARQLKELKESSSLNGGFDLLVDKANIINQFYLNGLKEQISSIDQIASGVDGMRVDNELALRVATEVKSNNFNNLVGFLDQLANEQEAQRLKLFADVTAAELVIFESIYAEGVATEVAWDLFFAKAETVRELGVRDELNKTKEAMKAAASALYVSDKAQVNSNVDAYFVVQNKLLDAHVSKLSSLILKRIKLVGNELADPSKAGDAAALKAELDGLQKSLKMPLDVVDAGIMTKIIEGETKLQTIAGTITALRLAVTTLKGFQSERRQVAGELSAAIADLLSELAMLKARPPESGVNLGLLKSGVGGLMVKLSMLAAPFQGFADAYKVLPADIKSQSFPKGAATKIVELEGSFKAELGVAKASIKALAAVGQAKAGCSVLNSTAQGPIQVKRINCGGPEMTILTAE